MKKILITGSKGFIGKNLISELNNRNLYHAQKYPEQAPLYSILSYDVDSQEKDLLRFTRECDVVCHLAGVNRPKDEKEFMVGNFGFTSKLLTLLKEAKNKAPILISSSVQAALQNPYGRSKKAGEDLLFNYGSENDIDVLIYRLPNVFGKWCRSNYNSAIATFCHNIAHNLDIIIDDRSYIMDLVYIDDVVSEFVNAIEGKAHIKNKFCIVPVSYRATLGKIVDLLYSFKDSRITLQIPDMSDPFTKKLYSTYLSYLPKDNFSFLPKMNIDDRGSFTEIFKSAERGQISVNILKPRMIKGNHWHHTKNEKFIVVAGKGIIRFRKINSDEILEYFVTSEKLEIVDIPPGYTHNIENSGNSDMITVMWANEPFDPEHPDTYYEEVRF